MAWNASALSLGSPRGNVVLGAPFDLVVGLQPDSGNDAGSSCVRAELLAGDRPIESSRVRVSPTTSGKAVRVQASYTVDEPVVTLKLWAGCEGGGISRSYTLLAQLPESVDATGNQPINVRELAAAQPALAAAGAGAAGAAGAASDPSSTSSRPAAGRSARADSRPAAVPVAKEPKPQSKPKTQPRPQAKPKAAAEKSRPPVGVTAQAQAGQLQAGLRIEPRLRMEPVEEWLGTGGTPGAAGAAGTPGTPEGAAASAAPMFDVGSEQLAEANKRVQALEAEMAAFKKRDTADRGQLAQLRAELDAMRQESGGSSWLFNALLLALIAAVAVIAWMAWKMRSGASLFSREPDAWRESVERSSQDPVPSSPPHSHDDGINTLPHSLDPHRPTRPMAPSLREHRPAPSPDDRRGPDTLASPYVQRGAQMRPGVTYELHEDVDPGDFGPATIPVPVSVQAELPEPEGEKTAARSPAPEAIKARRMVQPGEMFDVQQQAEFFISVGEHQQAIELLRSHIATHEDSSPLAYLELLHLYYTLSRRDDFDQLRARFAKHFNARVPAMPGFTDKGSSLLQGYPEQLARIEALWPVDEVEDCLAHYLFKQDGAPDPDAPAPFDLAAFDDLLLLLSIARTSPAGTRGEPGPRERTTPRMVAGTAAAGAATAGAAVLASAAEPAPAPAAAAAFMDVDWMAELQPSPVEAAPQQAASSLSPQDSGLEFTPMDTQALSTVSGTAGEKAADSRAPDSLSAPLQFEMQPLDFDLDQAGQLPAGQVRAVPLSETPSFIHDAAAPLLDIDLTALGEDELPTVDVPSRFPPVVLSAPGSGPVGFSEHNLKAPLSMDLALENWELQPPETLRDHRGLDEPLSRSVDMLLSRETDPAFRTTPQAPSPQGDGKEPSKD